MEGDVQDFRNTGAKDTKHLNTIVLDWKIKNLIRKSLLNTLEENSESIIMMEEIIDHNRKTQAQNKRMHKNMSIFFKAIKSMEFPHNFQLKSTSN